jgi:hypothetical protein
MQLILAIPSLKIVYNHSHVWKLLALPKINSAVMTVNYYVN